MGTERRWLWPGEAVPSQLRGSLRLLDDDSDVAEPLLKEADLVAIDFRLPGRSALEVLLNALGTAWAHGAQIDWSRWYGAGRRRRVPLPTYPFERKRYWVERPRRHSAAASSTDGTSHSGLLRQQLGRASEPERVTLLMEFLHRQIAEVFEEETDWSPATDEDLFHLGVDSLILIDILARLGTELGRAIEPSLSSPTIRSIAEDVARAWDADSAVAGRHP
jgi:phthiocerol/phenolphthiocerol synthesis type-I polyketide synthase E